MGNSCHIAAMLKLTDAEAAMLIILTNFLDAFFCPSIALGHVLAVESKPPVAPSVDAKQA